MYTVKLFHQLWLLKEHSTLNQILKVRVDTGTNASILCCPFTSRYVDVIANLVAQKQQHINTFGKPDGTSYEVIKKWKIGKMPKRM